MPIDKLYVRIKCVTCRGSRKYSAGGYYNSLEPGKWGACPYCDAKGTIYIEAALDYIVDFMIDIPQEKYDLILYKIAQKKSEEN
jgi:hypothetical protein